MTNPTPTVVFLQFGHSNYFEYNLNLAKKYSQQNVAVITDSDIYYNTNSINYKKLTNNRILQIIDAYEHVSVNNYNVELTCFLRWFFVLEFMKSENINRIFYLDSDVALCSPLINLNYLYQEYPLVVSGISGHSSFFDLTTLEEFCDYTHYFILKGSSSEKTEAKKKIAAGWNGGVSDMSAIRNFYSHYTGKKIDSSKIDEQERLNHNINVPGDYDIPGQYEFDGIRKIIQLYYNENSIFAKKNNGDYTKFATLHFQGRAKIFIEPFYTRFQALQKSPPVPNGYINFWSDDVSTKFSQD